MEDSGGAIKSVFNERQHTDYSLTRIAALETGVRNQYEKLRAVLGARSVVLVPFGSAAMGVATDGANSYLNPSDLDVLVVYDAITPSRNIFSELLVRNMSEHSSEVEALLISTVPELSVRGAFQTREVTDSIKSLLGSDFGSVLISSENQFYLHMITALLISKGIGDAQNLDNLKKDVISTLQSSGEQGLKLWEHINRSFQTHYVNYETDNVDNPLSNKREQRHSEALDQILMQRDIPPKKKTLATAIIKQRKSEMSLPPLEKALVLTAH